MHFPAKASLSVLLLAITQVQALICYETVILDIKTNNVTVVEKQVSSGFCEIVSCERGGYDMGPQCSILLPSTNGTTGPSYFKYGKYRQGYGSDCQALQGNYASHVCCNTDRCNTAEALSKRDIQDPVLSGLVIAGIVTTLVAIAADVYFLPMSTSPILKAIQGLKVFNLSTSIVVLILLCVSMLPFGPRVEYILVFVASILSIIFHSVDFARKKIVQTKVQIICETVILVLYIAGLSIIIDRMVPWVPNSSSLAEKCRLSPTSVGLSLGMSMERSICGFINALIGFGKFFFIL